MKKRLYVSCTDKRVLITFIVSIIIAILASILLCIVKTFHIINLILIFTAAYLGWIVSLPLLGILLVGILEKITTNKKNRN